MLLEGIFAAVTTCFYPDGRPYWRKLEANMDRYSLTPMSGMVLLGSTGEAVMLSDEESREALRVARDATAPEKVLLAGVARESVIETLRLADYAAELAYDAVLVRTPHFYRKQMRNREMLTYYQAAADRSPLPVLLYSVPSCTAYDLPIEVVAELAMHPNIVGMKDSSGNVARIAELVKAASARRGCCEVYTAWAEKDSGLAAEKQERIAKAGIEIAGKMGIPGVKYALDVNGYYGGRPRMPLLPLTGDEQRVVDELMADIRN